MLNFRPLLIGIAACTAGLSSGFPAQAAEFSSQYVNVGENDCPIEVDEPEEGPASSRQVCKAPDGSDIIITDYDARLYVAFDDGDQYYNFQSFTHIGNKLEWVSQNGKPVAAILRFFLQTDAYSGTENDDGTGQSKTQVLKITKIGGDGINCPMAFVDAGANSNANELARQAAYTADMFDCKNDKPYTLGKLNFHFGLESEQMGLDRSRSGH